MKKHVCGWVLLLLILATEGLSADLGTSQGQFDGLSKEAYKQKDNALLLRSRDCYGGSYRWQMIKHSDALNGAAVSMSDYKSDSALDAVVPGTVLNSLVYNKIYPEPYFGLNNAREKGLIPDITSAGREFYTYWFRTEFELTPAFAGKQVILQFDGINYRAHIWLNGHEIGAMAGMFQRGFFDITDTVHDKGKNAIAVLVEPIDVPGGFKNKFKEVRAVGENRNGGDGQIGKNVTMLMSVGWDFTFPDGIRDRNTGIWKDIQIFPVNPVELRDPFVKTELSLPDRNSSQQEISVDVINHSDKSQHGMIKAVIPQAGVKIEKEVKLAAHETQTITLSPKEFKSLEFRNPKLWWPFNKGPQNLYELTLTFEREGHISDTEKTRFAIRSVTSDQNTPDGSRQFYINGRPLFLHGTNWIPEAMLRNTEERTYAQLRYTRQAGVNFIRFWAGGIVESDYFFDLCDELGILVSMEFWQSGDTVLPEDRNLYRDNVEDTIKLLRNHPSVAYYISANERNADAIIPIKDLVDQYDGTRGWQTGSETDGIHDGSPYTYVNPMFYYDDSATGRGGRINGLCPEYGAPCLPTLDSLKEMMDVNDIWPVNKTVWDYHDGGGFHDMVTRYVPAIQEYGPVESAQDLVWKGQMVGAVAYRGIWECWTYNRLHFGDRFTTGLWYWYHNSPVRQVCGRMWDWSLEPTAALYYSQDAHEPIHAQYDFIKNTVSVNNEFYVPFEGVVSIRVLNLDMSVKYEKSCPVKVGSDAVANDLIKVDLPLDLSSVHFIRLDVRDTAGKAVSDTFYWRSTNDYKGKGTYTGPLYAGFKDIKKLPTVKLSAGIKKQNDKWVVALKNPSDALAFMIHVKLQDAKTKKPVRPAFYTDNFFSLLPGEEKTVEIEPYNLQGSAKSISIDGWNVQNLTLAVSDVSEQTTQGQSAEQKEIVPRESDWQLGPFVRPVNRPVIGPDKKSVFACPMTKQDVNWESSDAFNPAAVVFGGRICVLYRAEDGSGRGIGGHTSRIGLAKSDDGISFERNPLPVLYPDNDLAKPYEWKGGCEDPRVVEGPDGKFYIYYTMWNRDNPDKQPPMTRIGVASSTDLIHWVKYGPIFAEGLIKKSHKAASVVTKVQQGRLIAEKIKGRYWMYWGEDRICAATSEDLIHWTPVLDEKGELVTIIRPRPDSFDSLLTEAGPPAVVTEKGIILIYNGKNSGADKTVGQGAYAAGQVLLDKTNPTHLLDRCESYFFKPELEFEKTGQYPAGTVFVEGLVYFKEKWHLYYGTADSYVGVAVCEKRMEN